MFCVETAMKLLHWSCLVYDWLPEVRSLVACGCGTRPGRFHLQAAVRLVRLHQAQQGFCAALLCCASGYKTKQPCLQLLLLLPQDPGPWDMEFALGALGLEGWEEVWDPAVDMRVLIGWGRANGGPDGGRLVLAFRGTASFENVVTDLKVGGTGGHMGGGIGRHGRSRG